jgi:hypothetical protein
MLVIEQLSNGQRIIKIKRDWHPNRIGRAYNPNKNFVDSASMERVQAALLRKQPAFTNGI